MQRKRRLPLLLLLLRLSPFTTIGVDITVIISHSRTVGVWHNSNANVVHPRIMQTPCKERTSFSRRHCFVNDLSTPSVSPCFIPRQIYSENI